MASLLSLGIFRPALASLKASFSSVSKYSPFVANFRFSATPSVFAVSPCVQLFHKFVYFNASQGSGRDWKYQRTFFGSNRSKMIFGASSALVAANLIYSKEPAQCFAGPGPQLYTLAHATIMIYAGFKSFLAIQSSSPKDDRQWLTFWLLFSIFEMFSAAFDFILGAVLPYYHEIKVGILVFLGVFGGAEKIYPLIEQTLLDVDKVRIKYQERLNPAGIPGFVRPPSAPGDTASSKPELKPMGSFRAVTRPG